MARLWDSTLDGSHVLIHATVNTMRRAAIGYAISVVIGVALGLAVARSRILRAAVGSMITGLQTMPSIAWFPLAILLFQLTERRDHVRGRARRRPGHRQRRDRRRRPHPAGAAAGRAGCSAPGASAPTATSSCPAPSPASWPASSRAGPSPGALMAGELIVIIANKPSLGVRLQYARELSDAPR